MSVRNGLRYLDAAVESILAQTYSNFEFIIVDNGSTDGTLEALTKIAAQDERIRLLRNTGNQSQSDGLNLGLQACRGAWIARMDADDVALPDRLARQLAFVKENSDLKAVSCLAYYIDAKSRRVGKTFHDLTSREVFERYMSEGRAPGLMHPGALIDTTVLKRLHGYRSAFEPANDIDLWCRISDHGVVLVQSEYLMEYRVHGGSDIAKSFSVALQKALWARNCMRARRSGKPEPAWEAFLAQRRSAPWWLRLNRWRKAKAKQLYRQSALNRISSRVFQAVLEMIGATLLQPNYAVMRLIGQLYREPIKEPSKRQLSLKRSGHQLN